MGDLPRETKEPYRAPEASGDPGPKGDDEMAMPLEGALRERAARALDEVLAEKLPEIRAGRVCRRGARARACHERRRGNVGRSGEPAAGSRRIGGRRYGARGRRQSAACLPRARTDAAPAAGGSLRPCTGARPRGARGHEAGAEGRRRQGARASVAHPAPGHEGEAPRADQGDARQDQRRARGGSRRKGLRDLDGQPATPPASFWRRRRPSAMRATSATRATSLPPPPRSPRSRPRRRRRARGRL